MQKFIFWTGIYNIVAGAGFFFPGFTSLLGLQVPDSKFWVWFPAAAVIYTGIVLVISSRSLATRASLVYWEGILRVAAFLI